MANTKFNAYTAVKLQCDFDYGLPRHLQRTRSAKFPAQTAGLLLPGVLPIFYVHSIF